MLKPFLLTLEYPPQHGGVARYLEGEVKNFEGQVAVSVAKVNWKRLFGSARQEFKKSGCEELWISHVLPMGYIALVWRCVYKTPYRVYLHGLDLVRPKSSPWKRFWVKIILNNAGEIVVNSKATARLLENYGIEPSRARVQYPRIEKINTDQYKPIGEKLRQKYHLENKPVLLTISRLVKRKGIDLVIKSLPAVWRAIPDLVYVVVGDGEERERLSVIASPSGILGAGSAKQSQNQDGIAASSRQGGTPRNDINVIFTGAVTDEEKYGWLSTCNCFILTPVDDPRDFEGYGIVYKEAQLFGKPVIGSAVGGVPEAVGQNGILVQPGQTQLISAAIIKSI